MRRAGQRWLSGTVLVGVMATLMGCGSLFGERGYFRDRSMDYQAAERAPRYDLGVDAPEAAHQRVKPVLPVPSVVAQSDKQFMPHKFDDVPRPQVVELVAGEGRVQLLRDVDLRWLWVEADAASTYVWISQYFNDAGFIILSGSRVGQFLKTSWQEERTGSQGEAGFWSRSVASIKHLGRNEKAFERYRVQFSPTSPDGLSGTRVFVERQVVQAESLEAVRTLNWSENQSVEAAQAREATTDTDSATEQDHTPERAWWQPVVHFLDEQISASLEASSPADNQELSAQMRQDGNGWPVLTIDQPFARSWDAVGVALERIKRTEEAVLSIDDLDRSLAVYYVKWQAQNDRKPVLYQLHMAKGEVGVMISVQLDDNTVAPKEKSEQLLSLIERQLSEIGG
ncbi:MAG: outer membrane protein assembly factor BamC [Gammaproteobacteria bacterium]